MKLNIAVVFGHKSCEHDISIITACQLMKYLDTNRYNIIPIYITKENKYLTGKSLLHISNYPNNLRGVEVSILPNSNYLYEC
jgi:D-alanine-D-alanine ligase